MISLPHISRAAIGPTLLGVLIVALALLVHPAPRPSLAPASVVAEVAPAQTTTGPLQGTSITVQWLDIVIAEDVIPPADQQAFANELEQALTYVSSRLGSGPSERITAYVGLEASCGIHGVAYTNERMVQVYTCSSLPRGRAVNILAHEFVHQLAQDRYGERHLQGDLILLEGLATWGAGSYWLSGEESFRAFVMPWLAAGTSLPLATSYVGRPIGDMNTLYYQWASFVEFLMQVYGRERFDALYVTGSSDPGSADYQGVYGKPLAELEQEWRAWVITSP
ncbi:hypothetical protein OSCT_2478 [Oscillochloris trichoides DG-6]|uniref:Peptidase MA-like domain-containing protein n=1 Tax=Oscillochloris trichoides DG-6 TaxID=765420 RepID=E1IGM7_9CHLR|nr:hypothetical protein [Oscillochloris trichoides]EFO79662.1 hypothetical protein OSCT_2478 [Oscillochloris trichoides DG-6]